MFALAVESSCDETSLALLRGEISSELNFLAQINSLEVLGSLTSSQIEVHRQFGGVVPEVGARQHAQQIHFLFEELVENSSKFKIQNSKLRKGEIDDFGCRGQIISQISHIFVTSEPGLASALRVGMEFAKSLKFFLEKDFDHKVELEFVNHLQGHLFSCFYQRSLSVDNEQRTTSSGRGMTWHPKGTGKLDETKTIQNDELEATSNSPLLRGMSPSGDRGLMAQTNTENVEFADTSIPPNPLERGRGEVALASFSNPSPLRATSQGKGELPPSPQQATLSFGSQREPGRGGSVLHHFDNLTDDEIFPHLHLLVSGGNTQMIWLEFSGDWQVVGQTLDDAAGECLDKVGRMLGLPYPGGIYLAKIAGLEQQNYFDFPVAMQRSTSLDFSYSGLKTAVRYFLEKVKIPGFKFEKALNERELDELQAKDLENLDEEKLQFIKKACVSVQLVVVEQLVLQFKRAISKYKPVSVGLSGGVSANKLLRDKINIIVGPEVLIAQRELTGDNAVMIALAGLGQKMLAKN